MPKYFMTGAVIDGKPHRKPTDFILKDSFDKIISATLVSAETYKTISVRNREEFDRYIPMLTDRCIWSDVEIQLSRCVKFTDFTPFSRQPQCIHVDCDLESSDWVLWAYAHYVLREVDSGVIGVYFGEFCFDCNTPDVLLNGVVYENLYQPLRLAIHRGLLRCDGNKISIPVVRTNIQWSDEGMEQESVDRGITYRRSDFEFETAYARENAKSLLGSLNYEITDKSFFTKVLTFENGIENWRKYG